MSYSDNNNTTYLLWSKILYEIFVLGDFKQKSMVTDSQCDRVIINIYLYFTDIWARVIYIH